jgi:nicotinamidase/pyrazinamidase
MLHHHPWINLNTTLHQGTETGIDSYSAFTDNGRIKHTDMRDVLTNAGIKRVVVVGLATDYCVKATVEDAVEFGFETIVVVSWPWVNWAYVLMLAFSF